MSLLQLKKDSLAWANCPDDILLMIFKNLDMKSLINSMFVNKYWWDVVEYFCQHFNIWEKMIKEGMDNKGWTFKEKSLLEWRDIVLSARQWYHVKNAAVHLHNHYSFDSVRNICVYKDNLVVVTDETVKYFSIENFKLTKNINYSCLKYDETSSLIAELTLSRDGSMGYNVLTILNKLHNKNCDCGDVKKFILFDISLYKLHLNCCYVIDIKNVLWLYRAENCEWDVRAMAKYYGNKETICGLHIHEQDVYVLLVGGGILHVDLECKKFEKVCQLDVPMHYLDTKPFMFSTFSVLCPVMSSKDFQVHKQKENQVVIACPGLTYAMEHGPILLLGYNNGKIEIFLSRNLHEKSMRAELQFDLESFPISPSKIIAIDVHEGKDGHHIFVAAHTDVYEFLICEK